MPLSPLKPQARVLRKQQGAFNVTIKSTSPNAASGPRTHVKNHQPTTPQAAVIPQQPHTAPFNTKWSWKKWIMTLTGIVMTLVFGLLTVLSMYKSERLAIWTAKSDFRDACRADRDHGMLSRACNDTLAHPAPPPTRKETSNARDDIRDWFEPTSRPSCTVFELHFELAGSHCNFGKNDSATKKTGGES